MFAKNEMNAAANAAAEINDRMLEANRIKASDLILKNTEDKELREMIIVELAKIVGISKN